MNISEPFIHRPVTTALLTISSVLFGILAYLGMPVSDLPTVDYPVIQVSVGYPGANPETMAANVATPLERQFMQIPGLELVTSESRQGSTTLTLQFNLNKSIDGAATDVQTAITQATAALPVDLPSPPTYSKSNPNDQPIMYAALYSDSFTLGQLYDYASTNISQRIATVYGVSQVQVFGSPRAIRIQADPSALAARGLTMQDLNNAITSATSYQGAGQLDGLTRLNVLSPQAQLDQAEEYRNIIVNRSTPDHPQPVFLKDVAVVKDTVQDERINMSFWSDSVGTPSAVVILAISKQAGSNAVGVADSVKALFPEIQRQLPGEMHLFMIHDRSETIRSSIEDVQVTLLIAFVLVVLVIYIFLGRATDTLIPAIALPLSLLLTVIVMNILGYSMDNLSLMALTLAIGFLVDDAIVFLENVVRRMEKFSESPMTATLRGAQEISFTIVAMTISLAAVFVPLLFMGGLIGRVFREFSVTIVVAIFASGIVSLSLTPLMCSRLLSKRGEGARKTFVERMMDKIEHRVLGFYGRTLWFFIHHRWVSALIWIFCLGAVYILFQLVPTSFLPEGDSSFLRGVMIAPEDTSYLQMRVYQKQVEKALQQNPDVRFTFTMTGGSGFLPSNMGFVIALLKEPGERPSHSSIQDVNQSLTVSVMYGVPGVLMGLTANPVLEISTGAVSTQQGKYQYVISGLDPQEVYAEAGKLQGALMQFQGFARPPQSSLFLNTPNLEITPLRDQAALHNISATHILNLVRQAYSQNYSYLIKTPNNQYQVILETNPTSRSEPTDLSKLYVSSDDGSTTVPLATVASWHETVGPQSVTHFQQFTSVTFSFDLQPNVPISAATQFFEGINATLPKSITGGLQGEALTFVQTLNNLLVLMVLAVFVMYVILGILYESYVHPITVLSSLPVALVGGLLALYLFNEEASLYAFIGMFLLMGIVKKNGIMIVDFALQRIAEGKDRDEAIHEASMDRFRPIIMTTLAAVMGALPIVFGYGADGASRRPLGLVIVGGLLVSQLITLYVTPAIYLYMEQFQERVLNKSTFFRSTRSMSHADAEAESYKQSQEEDDKNASAGHGRDGYV